MTESNIKNLKNSREAGKTGGGDDDLFGTLGHVCDQLQTLEKFMARRFDEISMEINATSQQVDMAESGISRKFAEIFDVIKAISYSGDGTTPANAGVELDEVVNMTEQAANRILDAADRIGSQIHENWDDEEKRRHALENIDKDIEEIFIACSFQDITGQRIRKTLENLKLIEQKLDGALSRMGVDVDVDKGDDTPPPVPKASSQEDIDAIFKDSNK